MANAAPMDAGREQRMRSLLACFDRVAQTSETEWEARCPVHDDNRASLSIGWMTRRSDCIGVWCHAGCDQDTILTAVGRTKSDLFPPSEQTSNGSGGNIQQKIVATYDYCDGDGTLVFQVVRFEPKDFRQRRPDPDGRGGWSWSVKGCKVVPYKLPELLAADKSQPVYIVEGEKDVDRLRSLGLVATCNAGGASKANDNNQKPRCKWRSEHAAYLTGRTVIILPDNDQPGCDHAAGVAASLAGITASVKVVNLPGLPPKGDVSDWLAAGGTAEQLASLAAATTPGDAFEPVRVISSAEFFNASYTREYIVEGVLAAGEPCVIGGRSKTLKTSQAIELALAIGTGGKFLGQFQAKKKTVALLSGESGDYTIQETARRIAAFHSIDPSTANVFWGFDLPCIGSSEGLGSLDAMIVANGIEVLFLDPVYLSLMGDATRGLNASNLFDVGPLLKRIADSCRSRGTTLILLHHCRKNSANEKYTPPELEELAMAGFGEFARQWILTGRREEYKFDGNHKLWLSIGGSAGHGGSWALDISEGLASDEGGRHWSVDAIVPVHDFQEVAKQQREEKKDEERKTKHNELRDRVLKIIGEYPGGETAKFLCEKLQISGGRFGAIALVLEVEGFIERCEISKATRGTGRRRVAGWRLCEEPGEVAGYAEFESDNLDSLFSQEIIPGQPGQIESESRYPDYPASGTDNRDRGGAVLCNKTPPVRPGYLDLASPSDPGQENGLPGQLETVPVIDSQEQCQHEWVLSPDPYGRNGWQKKSCAKCDELFGYVPPASENLIA